MCVHCFVLACRGSVFCSLGAFNEFSRIFRQLAGSDQLKLSPVCTNKFSFRQHELAHCHSTGTLHSLASAACTVRMGESALILGESTRLMGVKTAQGLRCTGLQ